MVAVAAQLVHPLLLHAFEQPADDFAAGIQIRRDLGVGQAQLVRPVGIEGADEVGRQPLVERTEGDGIDGLEGLLEPPPVGRQHELHPRRMLLQQRVRHGDGHGKRLDVLLRHGLQGGDPVLRRAQHAECASLARIDGVEVVLRAIVVLAVHLRRAAEHQHGRPQRFAGAHDGVARLEFDPFAAHGQLLAQFRRKQRIQRAEPLVQHELALIQGAFAGAFGLHRVRCGRCAPAPNVHPGNPCI